MILNSELKEYKRLLEEDIELLGYKKLRYSIFAGENNNRSEYQLRIEYVEDQYQVYMTNERAWGDRKYEFTDIFEAMDMFLDILQSRVLTNRRHVKNGEPVEYQCELWDK